MRHAGQDEPVRLERVGGHVRVCADWQCANAGHYRVLVSFGGEQVAHRIEVEPTKINKEQFATLVKELEDLPASIALALNRLGAFAATKWQPPQKQRTLAEEITVVRRALEGDGTRAGLLALLSEIARRPHHVLHEDEQWRLVHAARRPHPRGVAAALCKPGNVVGQWPLRVSDRRAVPTLDVYENRILRSFLHLANQRLRRLEQAASRDDAFGTTHRAELEDLRRRLGRAQRDAAFLDELGPLRTAPDRVTQVILRNPAYRAAYAGYLGFLRTPRLHLDHSALDAPLLNTPKLYEAWGVLLVLDAMLAAAGEYGWRVASQTLVSPSDIAPFVRVLPNGAVLALERGADRATLFYQLKIQAKDNGTDLRSISFHQKPDLLLDVRTPSGRAVHIFDPKYKVAETDNGSKRPPKADIDKMHAYRDAIRDWAGQHVVRSAAILYLDEDHGFATDEVAAYQLLPGAAHEGLRSAIALALA